ncbi:MAG TPA: tetratricopeptide repeat protein [Terriglobia bacterium]|nr:tetratricopeptide repeat protein [Terriglobia bacterium]
MKSIVALALGILAGLCILTWTADHTWADGRSLSTGQGLATQGHASEGSTLALILTRAQRLIREGKLARASEVLSQGLKQYPDDATLLNFAGVLEAEENDTRAAEENFRKAVLQSPDYAGAYLNLGRLYQTEIGKRPGALSEAVETYQKLLKVDPESVTVAYQLASLQMQEGDAQASLETLRKLPARADREPGILAIRCGDLVALGQKQNAEVAARRLLASSELSEAVVLPVIPMLIAHHQEDVAIELLEGLKERHLASSRTLSALGLVEAKAGLPNQARSALEQASISDPHSVSPLLQLARLANQHQDYRAALGYLAHARALEPENASIQFFFGMVCVEADLHQEAYESLKRAVALDPRNPYYNYALGAVCTQREDAGEAIPYFKRYCALKPQDPRGKLALGAALYYSHDLDSARTELLQIANERATSVGANYFLGRIASDLGEWSEGERYVKRAIRQDPRYAEAYAILGNIYLDEKDYNRAAEVLRHALEIDPDNYLANLKLTVLYERTKDPRAEAQSQHFARVRKDQQQRVRLFLRTIRVVSY